MATKPLHEMTREEFVFHTAVMALQGSFANPSARATIASLVREADNLWQELQEWKTNNLMTNHAHDSYQ